MGLFRRKDPYPGLELESELGDGGQATVYRATYYGEPVAAKIFYRSMADGFTTELSSMLACGSIRPHPHIARLIHFYDGKRPCLVTQYIEGEDLFGYLRKTGPMDRYEARKVAAEIASGLCHLHAHGIVHRDFKSLNVMMASGCNDIIDRDFPKPVIIDLGVAGVRSSLVSSPQLGQAEGAMRDRKMPRTYAWGSVRWMTPEVLCEQRWSDKTDTYGFGIVYWEMLSGKMPFDVPGASFDTIKDMIIDGIRPKLSLIRHGGSEAVQLIQRCWDSNASRRPSMFEVMCLLQRKDCGAIFRQADLRDANSIDFGGFCYMCDTYAPGKVRRRDIHIYFEAINVSGSGRISFEEFSNFFWGWSDKKSSFDATRLALQSAEPTLPRALQRLSHQISQACSERNNVAHPERIVGDATDRGPGRSRTYRRPTPVSGSSSQETSGTSSSRI